jgi:hypothetical protein
MSETEHPVTMTGYVTGKHGGLLAAGTSYGLVTCQQPSSSLAWRQ